MTNIRQKEDKLLKEWHNSRRKENRDDEVDFVYDGMVDEEGYTASKPKIVYVLKEYAPAGQGHDLRSDLADGAGSWWWKVAYMTHNLQRICSPEKEIPRKPEPWNDEWLKKMHKSVCAFNLSKIGGNAYTNMTLLALQAMKRRDFVRRQFDLYNPDLTVCSGTFDIFRYVLGDDEIEPTNGTETNWYERSPGKYVVDAYHFSYPSFGYDMIDKLVDEIGEFYIK